MARTTVTVDVQRAARATDGAGGKTKTWANQVSSVGARMRHYTTTGTAEALDTAGAAPGRAVMERWLFIFDDVALGVMANDRIVWGTNTYRVLTVRPYERTLQVDTERVV